MHKQPYLGFGLGLRPEHYQTVLEVSPKIDWFEILTEDYLVAGGKNLYYLEQIRQHYPVVMHGVSLSIGSCDPLNLEYLQQVKQLADRIQPAWVSDHLCWTGVNRINTHDLLPLPYTEEALQHVVDRVKQVQDYLNRPILLENVSSYLTYSDSTLAEWEFLTEVANQADCLLLLDINNIYVSAFNHGFDAKTYIDHMPASRITQFHLAGHSNFGTHIVDSHDDKIIADVWSLYGYALEKFGSVSTLIERDAHIPPIEDLVAELAQARSIADKITAPA